VQHDDRFGRGLVARRVRDEWRCHLQRFAVAVFPTSDAPEELHPANLFLDPAHGRMSVTQGTDGDAGW
jgi:hypothetical protein